VYDFPRRDMPLGNRTMKKFKHHLPRQVKRNALKKIRCSTEQGMQISNVIYYIHINKIANKMGMVGLWLAPSGYASPGD
jgi:hypothetical protein